MIRRILITFCAMCALSIVCFAEGGDTLDVAVVTGTRVAVERDLLPVPVSIITRRTLSESDKSAILPVLMEQVPGLYVTSRGVIGYGVSGGAGGGINLRGFDAGGGRVLILIDGHPQFEAIYGHPVADQYLAEDALRVEVSRGASSVLYGSNAMGGAINIISRRPESNGNHLNIKLLGGSYGTFQGSLSDTYQKGKLTLSVNGGYERTDGHRANSAFNSKSGAAWISYDISSNWKVIGKFNLMNAYSENPGTVTAPMYEGMADVIRGMAGVYIDNTYDRSNGSLNLYYSWGNHIINDGYTEGGSPRPYLFHGTDYMGGTNIWQAVRLFEGNTLTAGADIKLYGGNAYRNPETEVYADHIKLHEFAGYIFDQQSIGPVMLNAGIRIERHKLYGTILVPQAGVSYQPWKNTVFKASASKGFRTPNMRELYMYAVANEDLKPEKAWSYDLTISQKALDGKLRGELSLFYTKGDNIIEVVQTEGRRQNRNAGAFENSGIELLLNYNILDNLSLNANYSYLHMSRTLTGAPAHKFYLGGRYNIGQFTFNAGAMAVRNLYLATGSDAVKENYVNVNARIAWAPRPSLSIILHGDNLLNRTYETILGFPMPGTTVLAGVSLNF